MTGGQACDGLRRVALAVEAGQWAPSPDGVRDGPQQPRAYSNVASRLPFFCSAVQHDMTFLSRQPLRLLPRLAAVKPHTSAIRSQVSAVSLLQHRFASKVSNASPKPGPRPYQASDPAATQRLGMSTLYCFVLRTCADDGSVPTTSANIQCPRSRGCYHRYLQARRPVYS